MFSLLWLTLRRQHQRVGYNDNVRTNNVLQNCAHKMGSYVTLIIRRLCNMPTFSNKGWGKRSIDTWCLEGVVLNEFHICNVLT